MEEMKKVLNEIITVGFFMFIVLTFLSTTKAEDLCIVAIFSVSYGAAKIKAAAEKKRKIEKKGDKKYEKDSKRNN